jgi:signal recognition particle GTPase
MRQEINKLLKMHRQMADMMKSHGRQGQGRRHGGFKGLPGFGKKKK